MDSLLPALLAAALAAFGDRPQRLAAVLADRFGSPGIVIAAVFAAALGVGAIAAIGAQLISPVLPHRGATLLLALALLFAGATSLFPGRKLDTVEGWKMGAFVTTALAMFILMFGDSAAFHTFGIAARGTFPAAAAIGAAVGTTAAIAPAALLGAEFERLVPVRGIRLFAAALFLIAGLWCALMALTFI